MSELNIDVPSKWLDKNGDEVHALSVDNDKGLVVIDWPQIKDRATRTVSIQKFLSQAVPIDSQAESAKENPVKPGKQFVAVWAGESQLNFGQSPNLQLSNQDWLEQGMHAKTVKFNIGQGGLPPEVNWEDHCAAIAMIDDKPAKALASILLWGSDTNWNWSRHFDDVVKHLATNMIERCNKDKRVAPQACTHSLPELARLMARMVLHFELYELWDVYTVKGRLQFSGIEVKASSYTTLWVRYQRQMMDDLIDMVSTADQYVSSYRMQLNRVDDNA
ncbi:MAG: hypothetical protein ACTH5M_00500 [Psychrobacter sp.]